MSPKSIHEEKTWYLSIGNLRDANNLMDEIDKLVGVKELEFPGSELMRLINYLLQKLVLHFPSSYSSL
ncbi:hypothetical protein CTI12_AA329700 [Artemisia annua]|uniref:Uncharacterized protein n=1 Tax=Artemisia annua TaxID=35608 RepID=A0A2U1MXU1_ARTAN|nr:hypothetical protein CTI12_AA329700 [Artemisia annua]